MKSNRRARAFNENDEGVSAIIGGILIAAFIAGAIVTLRVSFVPNWDNDAEAANMRVVERELLTIQADVAHTIGNRSAVAVAEPLSLATERGSILSGPKLPSEVSFTPTGRALTVTSPRLTIQENDTISLLGAAEDWKGFLTNTTVDSIGRVDSLRLRIGGVGIDHVGDAILMTIFDRNGAFVGDLRFSVADHPSGWDADILIRNSTGTTVYASSLGYFHQDAVTSHWIDVLSQELRVRDLFAKASAPLTISLSLLNDPAAKAALTASYAIGYLTQTSDGSFVVASGGVVVPNYQRSYSSGVLKFTSHNSEFVAQDYELENGALLLVQSDGATFKANPTMTAVVSNGLVRLHLIAPVLTGQPISISQDGTVTVYATPSGSSRTVAQAPSATFALGTGHPAAWTSYWQGVLAGAGLAPSQYVLATTPTSASVTVLGLSTSASDNDVLLTIETSQVTITVNG